MNIGKNITTETINNMKNKEHTRKAIYSTNNRQDYIFFAPLTGLMWRHVANYEPIILAINEEKENDKRFEWTLNFCRNLNMEVITINTFEKRNPQTIAQTCRLVAAASNGLNEQYMLTSDADMWPMEHQWFNQNQDKEVDIYNANAYDNKKYAMCYIGMKANQWRKILDIHENNIEDATKKLLESLPANASSDDNWNFDEKIFYDKITRWNGYPNRCNLIPKTGNRLDRSSWNYTSSAKFIDAHLLRPGFWPENWKKLRQVLNDKIKDQMSIVDEFYKEFIKFT